MIICKVIIRRITITINLILLVFSFGTISLNRGSACKISFSSKSKPLFSSPTNLVVVVETFFVLTLLVVVFVTLLVLSIETSSLISSFILV